VKGVLPLVAVVVAAGAGVGAWLWTRPAEPRAQAGKEPEAPPPDPLVEARLHDAVVLIQQADEREGEERLARAREAGTILADLDRQHPRDKDVVFWRGIAAAYRGDAGEARASLQRLGELFGSARAAYPTYLQALILLLTEPKRPSEAVRLLRGLPSRAPWFLPNQVRTTTYLALRANAEKLLNERSPDTAIETLNEAKALVKNDPARLLDTRMFLARALSISHRFVESQEEWEALSRETKGQVPGIEFGLATVHAGQNDWPGAIRAFTRVLELVDREKVQTKGLRALREALLRRGNAYRLTGENDKAKADLEAYVQEFPDDSRGWYWLGFFRFESLEDPPGAREALERSRALAPYCESTLRKLLQLYEVALPDAAKAKVIREEIENGAKERGRLREEATKRRGDGADVCS
jgi:tetratricopeptide (TPR) repeat protein